MSNNSIDYFATLGRREGDLTCKHLLPVGNDDDDEKKGVHPSEIWGDAITDIEVIYKGAFDCLYLFVCCNKLPLMHFKRRNCRPGRECSGPFLGAYRTDNRQVLCRLLEWSACSGVSVHCRAEAPLLPARGPHPGRGRGVHGRERA